MTKIVVNNCAGGFGLSHEAILLYGSIKKINVVPYIKVNTQSLLNYKKMEYEERPVRSYNILYCHIPDGQEAANYADEAYVNSHYFKESHFSSENLNSFRTDPALVEVVFNLGDLASGESAELRVIEVPDDVKWYLNVLDNGYENVHEDHRVWRAD